MNPDPRLAQLNELADQLSVRKLHRCTQEFLKRYSLGGNGWTRIKQAVESRAHDTGFVDKLETHVRDAVLAGYKRVFLLRHPPAAPAQLAPPMPEGERTDYLAGLPPALGPDDEAFYLGSRPVTGGEVFTFATSRPVRKSEEIDPSKLKENALPEHAKARIVARYETELRCYDHLVHLGDQWLLLLDAPDGVERSVLSNAEVNWKTLLTPDDNAGSHVFENLFPAVGNLWRDANEGIVNSLAFVSNKRARIVGKFSASSKENYRDHEFQIAGEEGGAQVSPFGIAVKWPDREGAPRIVLPGSAEMVASGLLEDEGAHSQPLAYMEITGNINWQNFVFVLERVKAHLGEGET